MDVARQLPQSMQLDGIDIDLSQCPPQEWLPSNVKLRQWDVFAEVPQEMVESYDIVCLRHFIMVVKDNDPAPLLQSVLKLLSACDLPHLQIHNLLVRVSTRVWVVANPATVLTDMPFRTGRLSPMG